MSAASGDGFSSLTSDGTYLYYYKLSDKHLWRYNPSTGVETDLMANYTPPVEEIVLQGNTTVGVYGGEIYYTNPLDGLGFGACLYKYNPDTKQHVKVLADAVAGVWFYENKLFYSTCIATNYALYCLDLDTEVTVKVNSDRCEDLIFEDGYFYYLNVSTFSSNRIMKMAIADIGTENEPEVIYDDKNIAVTGMYKIGDTFYFVMNPSIGKQRIYKYTIGDEEAVNLEETAFELVIANNTIYFYDDGDNEIKSCTLDGENVTTLVTNVKVNDLYIYDGKLYYSSTKKTVGVYCYDLSTKSSTKISSSVGEAFVMQDGKLWFVATAVEYDVDYPTHSQTGDGALYCYDGNTLTKK